MSRSRFWLSSVAATLVFAAAAAWLFPYGALNIEAGPARHRAWLLILWTSGVMCICFAAAALLSTVVPIGIRDVADAGSVGAAREARLRNAGGGRSFYNFGGWLLTTGILLLVTYFAGWVTGMS